MFRKIGVIFISILLMMAYRPLSAQDIRDSVINLINEHRKLKGAKGFLKNARNMKAFEEFSDIAKAIKVEDSAEVSVAPHRKIKYNRNFDDLVYKYALGLQAVADVDIKVFRLNIKNTKEALSTKMLDSNIAFRAAIEDTAYNEIGCMITKNNGSITCLIGITKRYIDFVPGFTMHGRSGETAMTLTGHSRLKELYYDERVNVPQFTVVSEIKPTEKKQIDLDTNGNFTITVPVLSEEEHRWKMLGFFDKRNKIVGYLPFHKFSFIVVDSIP